MPVEAKPLFRPDVLRDHLQRFTLPASVETHRPLLDKWATMLKSERANRFNEKELLPDFLTDIFCGLLGYARPHDSPERFTFSREKHVEVDGKFADAAIDSLVDFGEYQPFRDRHAEPKSYRSTSISLCATSNSYRFTNAAKSKNLTRCRISRNALYPSLD